MMTELNYSLDKKKLWDALANYFAYATVQLENASDIKFAKIETPQQRAELFRFRLTYYSQYTQYLLQDLNSDGSDMYDQNAYLFGAWYKDKLVATTRLCPYPFETLKFVDKNALDLFLGSDYQAKYLEWSRLLVIAPPGVHYLMPALTIYAGITMLATTNYLNYFGYTQPKIRKLMRKFMIYDETMEFIIPHRNNQTYLLLKGNFMKDIYYIFEKFSQKIR